MRIGVIGLGNAGMRHMSNLLALGHTDFIGYDQRIIARLPTVQTIEDFWKFAPDAVIIATPPQEHYLQAIDAIHRGVHVFVEKPLAITLDHARCLVEAASECDVRLHCGYQLRRHPSLLTLQSKIAESEKPIEYCSLLQDDMSQWPAATYERNMLLECSHELDVATWLMGSVTKLHALYGPQSISVFFAAAHGYGCLYLQHGDRARHICTDVGDWYFNAEENEQAYKDELSAFLEGRPGDDGLSTMRLIDAVQRSLQGEGWVTL